MVRNRRIKFTPQIFMLSAFAHALMQSLITVCYFYFFLCVLEGHKSSVTTSSIECDKWMRCCFQDPCSFIAAYLVHDISPIDTVWKLKMWRYTGNSVAPLKLTFTEGIHTEKKKDHDVFLLPFTSSSCIFSDTEKLIKSTSFSTVFLQSCMFTYFA